MRDIAVAYFFGAQADTDAFFLAYKVPYLLTLMVGGALTATFVPLFSYRLATGRKRRGLGSLGQHRQHHRPDAHRLSAWCSIVLAPWFIPLIGPGLRARHHRHRPCSSSGILMIGFVFAGLAGLVVGMLNSLERFALAAFARAVGTVVTLVVMVVVRRHPRASPLWPSARRRLGGRIPGALPRAAAARSIHYRRASTGTIPGVREVGRMVWPILIGSAVGKVSIFVDQVLG